MDRDFIYRQALVWLQHEFDNRRIDGSIGSHKTDQELAESLTNHLCNNWQMVERAKVNQTACPPTTNTPISQIGTSNMPTNQPELTRDTPAYYDRGE